MNHLHHAAGSGTWQRPIDLPMIEPKRQTVWGWPAVINFTLGGAGAGLYLFSLCLPAEATTTSAGSTILFVRILAAFLVGCGLLSLAGEAGRPFKARFLLGNLRRSWMARETLAAIVFLPAAVLSGWLQYPLLVAIAAAAAMAFILSQGFILYRASAIPAWNTPLTPVLFVTSGLTSGGGVLLALTANIGLDAPDPVWLGAAIVCSVADVVVWWAYLERKDPFFQASTEALRTPRAIFWTVIGCRLIPMLLTLSALAVAEHRSLANSLLVIAGSALFAGSWIQKTGIIRTCGYLRPIGLSLQSRRRI